MSAGIAQPLCVRTAEAVRQALLLMFDRLRGMEGREGAGFYAATLTGVPLFYGLLGSASQEKALKYQAFAVEKATRVARTSRTANQHRSRDSADESLEQYPGAVAGIKNVWSISGYKSHVDELGSIAWACLMDDITPELAERLAQGNDHDTRVLEVVQIARGFMQGRT